jgi:hypothetical protein
MNILAILNLKKENHQYSLSTIFYAISTLFHKVIDILVLTEEDREQAGIYLGYEKADK